MGDKIRITVAVQPEVLAVFDELAATVQRSRSEVVGDALEDLAPYVEGLIEVYRGYDMEAWDALISRWLSDIQTKGRLR